MPQVVHNGLRISYEVSGSGEPVLFLPGTSTDSSMWMAGVATYFERFRSIMVDPRDTPKSDEGKDSYAPVDLAAEAVTVLNAAGAEPAHVVGYSLGGTVAQELAVEYPQAVRSLTLVCTWARTDEWLKHVFEWLRDGLLAAGMTWADRALLWLTLGPEFHKDPIYEGALHLLSQRGQSSESLVRQLECDIVHDSLARLGSVTCQTLVIAGATDTWIPHRYGLQLKDALPHSRFESVDSGHGFPIEQSELFYSLLREHIGRG